MKNEVTGVTVTIDLSNSHGDNIELDSKSLIHYKAFQKIENVVDAHIQKIRNSSEKTLKTDSNLTIFIDGTRGAGKSTFLKNSAKALIESKQYSLTKLIYIDPSKIELHEHIFLTLIAQLNRKINESKKSTNTHSLEEMDGQYEAWRKQFKKLAGGLKLLNSGKNPYDLIDEDVFLDWGVHRADDAMQLPHTFVDLIKQSCMFLNIDAFIILIDDADTHFKKGEQVLEMVRRYLDTPQIIVMMAGDLKLYSDVVRGLYLGNMSENLYKYDQARANERSILLNHMEDQYLKKLFPIQNRILLQSLKQLVKEANYQIQIPNKKPEKIDDVINKLIKIALHTKAASDIQAYREFILQQPLRSVLQLLQASAEAYNPEINSQNVLALTSTLSQSLRDVFLSSLYAAKVEVDKLNNADENALIESVFNTVIQEGSQDTGTYLRPQASNEVLRNSFVALAASVAEFTQGKASSAISYMLQCSGSVSLFYHIKDELQSYTSDEASQIQLFKSYCGIGQHEDTLNWAWHATAVLMSKKSSSSIKAGIIRLTTTPDKKANKITAYDFIKEDRAGSLPFALGLIEVEGRQKQLYFSIFNVLGVIVRLLKFGEQYHDKTKVAPELTAKLKTELKAKVEKCLRKLGVTLGVSEPKWSNRSTDQATELEDRETENIDQNHIQQWVDNLCNWLIESDKQLAQLQPSSILLGKVWIRLYFSLIGVAKNKKNWTNVGHLISMYTHCLINALLIEEADHHISAAKDLIETKDTDESIDIINEDTATGGMSRVNPQTSIKIVTDKLNQLKDSDFDSFPLSKIILDCPITQGLMLQGTNSYKNGSTFVSRLSSNIDKVMIANVTLKDTDDSAESPVIETLANLEKKLKQKESEKLTITNSLKVLHESVTSLNGTRKTLMQKQIKEKESQVGELDEQIEFIESQLESFSD